MQTKDAVSMIQLKEARCQKALSLEQQKFNWYAEHYGGLIQGLIEMNVEHWTLNICWIWGEILWSEVEWQLRRATHDPQCSLKLALLFPVVFAATAAGFATRTPCNETQKWSPAGQRAVLTVTSFPNWPSSPPPHTSRVVTCNITWLKLEH